MKSAGYYTCVVLIVFTLGTLALGLIGVIVEYLIKKSTKGKNNDNKRFNSVSH